MKSILSLAAISILSLATGCNFAFRERAIGGPFSSGGPTGRALLGLPLGPDIEFGAGGRVTRSLGQRDEALAVGFDVKGRILTVGSTFDGTRIAPFVLRHGNLGAPDTSFGEAHDGKVVLDLGTEAWATAVAALPSAAILIAGQKAGANGYDFFVSRLDENGGPDRSFGSNGTAIIDLGGSEEACSVLVDSNGIYVVGTSTVDPQTQVALAHLDLNGALLSGGKITTNAGNHAQATAAILSGDGRIFVAGRVSGASGYDALLVSYDVDGRLDLTFGPNRTGIAISDWGGSDEPHALALQKNGTGSKIVLVGSSRRPATRDDLALARYTMTGQLDSGFGPQHTGFVSMDLGSHEEERLYGVAIDDKGRLVAAGTSYASDQFDFLLTRFSSDGVLSMGEKLVSSFDGHAVARAVAIGSDGQILFVGNELTAGKGSRAALAAYVP